MTAQTSTQAQVIPKFGEQKKAFSIDELKRLINAAKNMRDLNQAKEIKNLKHIPDKNINKLIRPITKVFYTQSEQGPLQKVEFNINKWFMIEYSTVCVATCDPQKSRIFKLGGQLYLNIFPGFLHILCPISTFESTTHLAVKFIFSHIQDIWCSGDWNLTEYIIKWLAGVAAGRKMYSILYLKSGQGWGKSIITDFIQRSVLGTQLVYKTSDPQTILGSFNGQLQGKVLLLLEKIPTEKSQWNNLYRSLKDKVTGDIMEIHEKYKMPTHYKNFISTIVLTNENALRVENDDRHTVFLDVSPSRKGDLNYFKKLSDAMKYPGTSEAFYAYLRAIADAYPDFNGNPPPMTTSKQDHIISTLPPLFQFIKDTYLIVKNHITDLPVQEFYRIHETDEINIEGIDVETPEKPASDPNALVKFLANIYNPASKSQVDQEEVELVVEKPAEEKPAPIEEKPTEKQPVAKKAPPPVPPKPDCLKVKPAPVIKEDPIPEESPAPIESDTNEIIDSFSDCYLSDEVPDQENELPAEEPAFEANDDYDVLDNLLSDSDSTTADQVPEQQPESPAESSAKSESLADSKSSTEPVVELTLKKQPILEPDTELEVDWDPEPKEGKDLWAKYQNASDEYDWEILAFEVEECPTTRIEDKYQYYFREVVDHFKDWIEYNGNSPKTPSRKELTNLIRVYKEDRDAKIISTTSGYETMKMNKGKAREIPEERPKTDMEREWEAANGIIDDWDEEDTEGAINDIL
ncbi:highly derived D5-like helicase-primase [Rhizophagus irregularis DAOM 181602=DAOM 197198]|nr:highly derived D5-like helicase-primase [Rhizophagus irregularis DAOM 181602=DAOM 197198]